MSVIIDMKFIDWLYNQDNLMCEYLAEKIKMRIMISAKEYDEIQKLYDSYVISLPK